jgi:Big-like domain-containing protein/VCBS repeat protein
MSRNVTAQVRNLNVVTLFAVWLTLMVALAGRAQQIDKGRPSAKSIAAGNPLFLPAVPYGTGGIYSASVAVADVNNDGKHDLLVANQNNLGVLLGNGDGTFQPAVNFGRGGNSIAVADVNADGRPDLVVAGVGLQGLVDVLLGNGDGSFKPAVSYSTNGNEARSVAIADLNGDGPPDLIVANCAPSGLPCLGRGSVGILLGNGDGTFQPVVTYDSGGNDAFSVAAADINGDALADLVVSNACSDSSCAAGSVAVLLGNGNGTFAPPIVYPTAAGAFWVTVADVNRDGRPDLLVADGAGVDVLLGNGDGSFQSAVTYDPGAYNDLSVAVGDLNGDGVPDLITAKRLDGSGAHGLVNVLLGNGDGTFKSALSYPSGGFDAWSVAIADFNGDGKPDVVAANLFSSLRNYNGTLGVLLGGNPTTSTALASSLNPSTYGQKVTWTATVTSSGSVTPTGKVRFTSQFFTETFTIGSATLNSSGVATLTRSNLNAATYPLTAVYAGDAAHLGSTSSVVNQVVLQAKSTATLTSSPNPSTQSLAVTFTAKISSPTVVPAGPVTFTSGKTVLGTAQLSGGKAKLAISSLPVGLTKVTVTYYGNSNIAKSSASVVQTVQ